MQDTLVLFIVGIYTNYSLNKFRLSVLESRFLGSDKGLCIGFFLHYGGDGLLYLRLDEVLQSRLVLLEHLLHLYHLHPQEFVLGILELCSSTEDMTYLGVTPELLQLLYRPIILGFQFGEFGGIFGYKVLVEAYFLLQGLFLLLYLFGEFSGGHIKKSYPLIIVGPTGT